MTDGYFTEDGKLLGSGFLVAPGLVLTCAHVISKVPLDRLRFGATPEQRSLVLSAVVDHEIDVALVRIPIESSPAADRPIVLSDPSPGAPWRVSSRPRPSDPLLSGIITGLRNILNADGFPIDAWQFDVEQILGGYAGYSGSAIYSDGAIVGILAEQVPLRTRSADVRASNVLYGIPISVVVERFHLELPITPPLGTLTGSRLLVHMIWSPFCGPGL